jgi:hypothetical protein
VSSQIFTFWDGLHVLDDTAYLVSADIHSLADTVADFAAQLCKGIVCSESITVEVDDAYSFGRPCLWVDVGHCGLLVVLEAAIKHVPLLAVRGHCKINVAEVSLSCLSSGHGAADLLPGH